MTDATDAAVHVAYNQIRAEATALAGRPEDIPQRVAVLHSIFLDSAGGHAFPQVALHGALWSAAFFDVSGTLGNLISYRYFYDPTERRARHAMLHNFAVGFRNTNRLVFIDTYTNYYFTKVHGEAPAARELLPRPLLDPLNRIHTASRIGQQVAVTDRATLYRAALELEQEATVAPGVQDAMSEIDCPILTRLLLKPIVRFRYFPRLKYFWFRNFSDKAERIAKAVRAYEIAEHVGWEQAERTMQDYGVLPGSFFANPKRFVDELRCKVTPRPSV